MKVLVVDDDSGHLAFMTDALGHEGYRVMTAGDGHEALLRWQVDRPDLVLLDAILAKVDGFEVCRQIRHESDTPVILLTARRDEADVVRGLQLGADDYVTKPFSLRQVVARMQAVLRRYQHRQERRSEAGRNVRAGDLVLNSETHSVRKGGRSVVLTRLEFRLLQILAMNESRVVPHARLIEYAWGYESPYHAMVLKSHIGHLRRKLGVGTTGPGAIQAVIGIGYTLVRAAPAAPKGAALFA